MRDQVRRSVEWAIFIGGLILLGVANFTIRSAANPMPAVHWSQRASFYFSQAAGLAVLVLAIYAMVSLIQLVRRKPTPTVPLKILFGITTALAIAALLGSEEIRLLLR